MKFRIRPRARMFLLRGLLASGVCVVMSVSPASAAPGDTPAWHKDFATAKAVAKQGGKPLFVVLRCER